LSSQLETKIDPSQVNVPDDAWELFEVTDDFVRHRAVLERHADGTVLYIYRTTPRGLTSLLEANKRSFDESSNQRFGDGKIVGRIPLNVLFDPNSELSKKMREGDKDHLKWFLNSEAARPYRTFRGKV
jgi:hypothetical protein